MGKKFCGCCKFRSMAWVALGLEIAELVLAVISAQWAVMGGTIAKVVLCAVCVCCCKKDACPRCAAAVLFFVFAGFNCIWVFWRLATMEIYAHVFCAVEWLDGKREEYKNEEECLDKYRMLITIFCLIGLLIVALEITFGIMYCQWWSKASEKNKVKGAQSPTVVVVQQQQQPMMVDQFGKPIQQPAYGAPMQPGQPMMQQPGQQVMYQQPMQGQPGQPMQMQQPAGTPTQLPGQQ